MDQAGILRQLARKQAARACRAIAVTSGKGGVGKTNVSVNLAVSLARLGYKVGILDGDLGMANVDIVLGVVPRRTLTDVLFHGRRLDEIHAVGPEGILVMAGGSGVYELANLSEWRLQRFVHEIGELDRMLDIVIIDTGAGISKHVINLLLASDEIIVVTTSELTSITDAYGVIKLVAARNPQAAVQIVVNMAPNQASAERVLSSLQEVTSQFVQASFTLDFLGYLPDDPVVKRAVYEQVPFVIGSPGSKAALAIEQMARRLVHSGEQRQPTGIGSMFRRMIRMIQGQSQG